MSDEVGEPHCGSAGTRVMVVRCGTDRSGRGLIPSQVEAARRGFTKHSYFADSGYNIVILIGQS